MMIKDGYNMHLNAIERYSVFYYQTGNEEFHKSVQSSKQAILTDFDKQQEQIEKFKNLAKITGECIETMQEIKFICQRAKKFGIEEKDIDDILGLLKGKV